MFSNKGQISIIDSFDNLLLDSQIELKPPQRDTLVRRSVTKIKEDCSETRVWLNSSAAKID